MLSDGLLALGLTPDRLSVIGFNGLFHVTAIAAIWAAGLKHRDHSMIDAYWGFSFVISIWITRLLWGQPVSARGVLVSALVTVWSYRLGYHLFNRWIRMKHAGGDLRYQDLRDNKLGDGYWWKSLVLVMESQAVLIVIASLNMLMIIMSPDPAGLTLLDKIGAAVVVAGFAIEAWADLSLEAFKANPANHGKVLRTGIWSWSRHPNYFGNLTVYWGLFLISLSVPGLLWTVMSPVVMTFILVSFTGKALMDDHMRKRRPEYADYIDRTSGFVPWPPKAPKVL